MKAIRRIAWVLVVVVGLAFVTTPAWADDDVAVTSAWDELVQWMVDLVTPETASDPEPDPGDELGANVDPTG